MTKKEFLDIIKQERDLAFIKRVAVVALESLPSNFRDEYVTLAYMKYIHTGRIIRAKNVRNGAVYHFITKAACFKHIQHGYPKAAMNKIHVALKYHDRNGKEDKVVYDHVLTYIKQEDLKI